MIQNLKKSSVLSIGILIVLSLIWGSSFILIKKSLIAFKPDEVAALRIFIAAIAFIPLALIHWKKIDWSLFKYFALVGIFGNAIPAYLFAVAETELSSSIAGVLNGLTPLFTVILGVLLFGAKFKWIQLLGVLLGFTGAAILMLFGNENAEAGNLVYGLLIVLATMCYAISVNGVNKFLSNSNVIHISVASFIIIGPFSFFYLLTTDVATSFTMSNENMVSIGAVILLSLLGTFVATILFFKLVQITDAVVSSTVAFLIPIVSLLWGVVDGEYLSIYHLVGMLVILSSIYLIRK